jgi:hypothetical protein
MMVQEKKIRDKITRHRKDKGGNLAKLTGTTDSKIFYLYIFCTALPDAKYLQQQLVVGCRKHQKLLPSASH